MLKLLEYFGISSDQGLLLFILLSLGLALLMTLIFSYSEWFYIRLKSFLCFRRPQVKSVIGEHCAIGQVQLYRLRWQVNGAEWLEISPVGEVLNLNPFRRNRGIEALHRSDVSKELYITLKPDITRLELSFQNFWGNSIEQHQIDSIKNIQSKDPIESQREMSAILYRAYLREAKEMLLQRFSQTLHDRKIVSEFWSSRYNSFYINAKKSLEEKLHSIKNPAN